VIASVRVLRLHRDVRALLQPARESSKAAIAGALSMTGGSTTKKLLRHARSAGLNVQNSVASLASDVKDAASSRACVRSNARCRDRWRRRKAYAPPGSDELPCSYRHPQRATSSELILLDVVQHGGGLFNARLRSARVRRSEDVAPCSDSARDKVSINTARGCERTALNQGSGREIRLDMHRVRVDAKNASKRARPRAGRFLPMRAKIRPASDAVPCERSRSSVPAELLPHLELETAPNKGDDIALTRAVADPRCRFR